MKINYINGDATKPTGNGYKVITHICNDLGKWGKGFVVAISKRWKEPEQQYRAWHKSNDRFALGEVQFVEVEKHLAIANIIGQEGITADSTGRPPIRYEAVREGLKKVAAFAEEKKATVHMPRMGAGLAGGKWEEIEAIVQEELADKGIKVTVYDFE